MIHTDHKFHAAVLITSAVVTCNLPVAAAVGVGLAASTLSKLYTRNVQKSDRANPRYSDHAGDRRGLSFAQ